MDLRDLVKNPKKCDELLEALDSVARDIDHYEYGLPIYNDSDKARLREIVYRWSCDEKEPQS